MSSKIRVLDEHTINQIAAGEVIENPASVVKELVENSIDAGGDNICVEIRGGGRQLIRVTDNGCGMSQDDALLCLERHATSKIRHVADISEIYSMGFRGEAIPSIASISKFMLLTCLPETEMGTMVVVEGGKIIRCCPVAHSKGTTIEVKSLFFNVPVRRKFQRSPAYDANEILKMLQNIALGNPHIHIELISDQKIVFTTHLSAVSGFQHELEQRVKDLLGIDFLEHMLSINEEKQGLRVQGLIGLPTYTRHNRTGQHLFINKRPIVSPLVAFAIRGGYGTALPTNRHPVFVLHLTVPGDLVDVNVHPQKREVRLRQDQTIKEILIETIQRALQGRNEPTFIMPRAEDIASEPNFILPIIDDIPPLFYKPIQENPNPKTPIVVFEERPYSDPPAFTEIKFAVPPSIQKAPLKVLAVVKPYLLLDVLSSPERKEGICLCDPRAAHSRIIFEKLVMQLEGKCIIESQSLLIPYTFQTTPVESVWISSHAVNLQKMGFSVHQSGPNVFAIDAIPTFLSAPELAALILELAQYSHDFFDNHELRQEQIKRMAAAASHAAINRQTSINLVEAQALVDQLMACEMPYQCPLGKPTMIYLNQDELSKRFQKG